MSVLSVAQALKAKARADEALAAALAAQTSSGAFVVDALIASGNAAIASNIFPAGILVTQALTNPHFRIRAGTAPVGSSFILTISRNGVTVATLTLTAGSTTLRAQPTVKFAAGDILNASITSVGSSTPAANVALTISSVAIPYSILNTPGLLAYYDLKGQGAIDGQGVNALADTLGGTSFAGVGTVPTFDEDAFGPGKPGLVWPSVANGGYARESPLEGLSEFTIAMIVKPTQANGDNYLISSEVQASLKFFGASRLTLRLSTDGSTNAVQQDTGPIANNAVTLVILRVSAAQNKAQVEFNGVSQIDVGFSGAIHSTPRQLGLGAYFDGGAPMRGVMGNVVLGNKYLSGGDLSDLRTALGATAGLSL